MPVLVIKAKAGSPAQRERLLAQANQKASGLLEGSSERVLVVYDEQAASIYYEDNDPRGDLPGSTLSG